MGIDSKVKIILCKSLDLVSVMKFLDAITAKVIAPENGKR